MQIDRSGQPALAEVMRYDAHKVRHEVRWSAHDPAQLPPSKRTAKVTLLTSATSWVDFAADILYKVVV
jgi:hypothetical protein